MKSHLINVSGLLGLAMALPLAMNFHFSEKYFDQMLALISFVP
jgi:hypothetical protein